MLLSNNALRALVEAYNGVIDHSRQLLVLEVFQGNKIPTIVELPLSSDVKHCTMYGLTNETRSRINQLRVLP